MTFDNWFPFLFFANIVRNSLLKNVIPPLYEYFSKKILRVENIRKGRSKNCFRYVNRTHRTFILNILYTIYILTITFIFFAKTYFYFFWLLSFIIRYCCAVDQKFAHLHAQCLYPHRRFNWPSLLLAFFALCKMQICMHIVLCTLYIHYIHILVYIIQPNTISVSFRLCIQYIR